MSKIAGLRTMSNGELIKLRDNISLELQVETRMNKATGSQGKHIANRSLKATRCKIAQINTILHAERKVE